MILESLSLQDDDYNSSAIAYYDLVHQYLFDFYLIFITSATVVGFAITVICGMRIYRHLQVNAMSTSTKRIQRKLMIALVIQALMPGNFKY